MDKVLVQLTRLGKSLFSNSQGSAGGPEQVYAGIVLPPIFLDGGKDAAPKVGVPETIHESAGGSGVLE
ncbi:hypothetical protein ES703_121730 [subsurface metagenome]